MLSIHPSVHVWGRTFSPQWAETATAFAFSEKNEPGEIGTSGRYIGKPIPFGSGDLRPGEFIEARFDQSETWISEVLTRALDGWLAAGATEVVVHLDVAYINQCNLEFSPWFLKKLGELMIPLTISCYEADMNTKLS